jgi:hypothetical protein
MTKMLDGLPQTAANNVNRTLLTSKWANDVFCAWRSANPTLPSLSEIRARQTFAPVWGYRPYECNANHQRSKSNRP